MSKEFKAGDKVYYPQAGHSIFEVQKHPLIEYALKIYPDNGTAEIFTEDGKRYSADKAVSICHTTPEKQKQLEELHGIKLEDASVKPTSKEIVKAYLDRGDKNVCCWVSDFVETPTSVNEWVYISDYMDDSHPFTTPSGCGWKFATPFDHTTLQPITELPKGEN